MRGATAPSVTGAINNSIFQPTRPLRGATEKQEQGEKKRKFQPTRPLRGATDLCTVSVRSIKFQPTRPLRGATYQKGLECVKTNISTHAPLAGRDKRLYQFYKDVFISTHAPLAGRDAAWYLRDAGALKFQPTRPLRGATRAFCFILSSTLYFNPRAPCGARQQKSTNHYAHFCDNRQISDAFAQNAACQGILLLFDAGKPCGFWVRTAQVISAHLCFAL